MATKRKRHATSFQVLAMCKRLVTLGHINTKELSEKLDMSRSALNQMLTPGYSNKSLSAIDGIRAEVRTVKAKLDRKRK